MVWYNTPHHRVGGERNADAEDPRDQVHRPHPVAPPRDGPEGRQAVLRRTPSRREKAHINYESGAGADATKDF